MDLKPRKKCSPVLLHQKLTSPVTLTLLYFTADGKTMRLLCKIKLNVCGKNIWYK